MGKKFVVINPIAFVAEAHVSARERVQSLGGLRFLSATQPHHGGNQYREMQRSLASAVAFAGARVRSRP